MAMHNDYACESLTNIDEHMQATPQGPEREVYDSGISEKLNPKT